MRRIVVSDLYLAVSMLAFAMTSERAAWIVTVVFAIAAIVLTRGAEEERGRG